MTTEKQMTSLKIIARQWLSRTTGVIYNSIQILINGETVFCSDRSPFLAPGYNLFYGKSFLPDAQYWLYKNGYIPKFDTSGEFMRYVQQDLKIPFDSVSIKVTRKRDLLQYGGI